MIEVKSSWGPALPSLSVAQGLRVLLVHNEYQMPGGEDIVVEREKHLLLNKGHTVLEYRRLNAEINTYGLIEKATLPFQAVWAKQSCRDLKRMLKSFQPGVVHFHNTFPLISPAAYYACRTLGVAVVQTIHNPRLLCPGGNLQRDGRDCDDCVGKTFPWPAALHACYRSSHAQSAVAGAVVGLHRILGTWDKAVDVYVASTDFYRERFIAGGLPADRVMVKPHFVEPDPNPKSVLGEYALFIGRLTASKGIPTLLKAWKELPCIRLKIRGEGPLYGDVLRFCESKTCAVQLLPRMSRDDLVSVLKRARFLVWPSEGYYESFGLVAIESFACGVPVIASDLGVMREIVHHRQTGLHFTSGDPVDLAAKVRWAWEHSAEMEVMGQAARAEYEAKYTGERNYKILMDIYGRAMQCPPLPDSHGKRS